MLRRKFLEKKQENYQSSNNKKINYNVLNIDNENHDNNQELDNVENVDNKIEENNNHSVENEMFTQYYAPKKDYRFTKSYGRRKTRYHNNERDNDGFISVAEVKRHVNKLEKVSFDSSVEKELQTKYKLMVHNSSMWNVNDYCNVKTVKTWKDVFTALHTFKVYASTCIDDLKGVSDKHYYDFNSYFMRDGIYPMWEHPENRNGSSCSLRIDSLEEGYKVFEYLVINMINHTLLEFVEEHWNIINGISFSPKMTGNYEKSPCVIIKIWFKKNFTREGGADKYLTEEIREYLRTYSDKYPIKTNAIKPEY